MTDNQQERDHQQFVDELPDLAAGVLGGRERAVLLEHVNTCPSCKDELDQLMAAADSLVHLAAEVDPPVGFETRVMDRIQGQALRHDRGRRRWVVGAAAAAVVVLAAFGIGWATHSGGKPPPVAGGITGPRAYSNLQEAALTSGGRSLGMVTLYSDEDGWLLMSVEGSKWSGPVECRVIGGDGKTRTIGTFHLVSGKGAWVAPLPPGVDGVRAAELVGARGHVLATAQFS